MEACSFFGTLLFSLRIHSAIVSWTHSYFENVMTNFKINQWTDAKNTDANLLIRAHAGLVMAQLKKLSISRACNRNNSTLIRDGAFSSLGTATNKKLVEQRNNSEL